MQEGQCFCLAWDWALHLKPCSFDIHAMTNYWTAIMLYQEIDVWETEKLCMEENLKKKKKKGV